MTIDIQILVFVCMLFHINSNQVYSTFISSDSIMFIQLFNKFQKLFASVLPAQTTNVGKNPVRPFFFRSFSSGPANSPAMSCSFTRRFFPMRRTRRCLPTPVVLTTSTSGDGFVNFGMSCDFLKRSSCWKKSRKQPQIWVGLKKRPPPNFWSKKTTKKQTKTCKTCFKKRSTFPPGDIVEAFALPSRRGRVHHHTEIARGVQQLSRHLTASSGRPVRAHKPPTKWSWRQRQKKIIG